MNLHVLPAGPLQTNAYLLTDSSRGQAVLIDAPDGIWHEVKPILDEEKCELAELWLTHGHWDHMEGGAELLAANPPVRVRAHPADRPLFETPEVMKPIVIFFMGSWPDVQPVRIDHWLKHGERFPALGTEVEIRHVPGHCPGNVLFYFAASVVGSWAGAGAAFVGDTLFCGGTGRTDIPGGDPAVLANSIRQQIYSLPDTTLVYPGHGPATTVGHEKLHNPYVDNG